MGYLPEAMRNYLSRLGWGHGDDEIFSEEQAVAWFDVADVVRIAKPHCVGDAQRGAVPALRRAGVEISGTVPQHIPDVYPDITHAEDWDRAVEVAGRWITDDAAARFAAQFTLIGTADDVEARVRAAVTAGADSFYLRHFRSYVLPEDLIDTFGSTVMGRFIDGP